MKLSRLHVPWELLVFAAASVMAGAGYSLFDSIFNNFLNATFALTGFQRSFLEFPRELPGFLVVFVTALLGFLCSRRLGAVAMLLGALGALLIGLASPGYAVMVVWLFIYSLGQHLFMPIAATIGMELAPEGQAGRRLGQLNGLRNLAAILGSILVVMGFKYLGFTFALTFVLAALALLIAGGLMLVMKAESTAAPRAFLTLRREYRWYYLLSIIAGARKQLFLTFAPWVLVSIFQQPTQIIASLLTLSGVVGIIFQPLLGWTIDHWGERFVLMTEAVALVGVCLGYGFSRFVLPETIALGVVCSCYILDQM